MFDRFFKRRNTGLESSQTSSTEQAIRTDLNELIGLRMQARQLAFSSRNPSVSLMAGNHVSHFKGRGMDYMESRGYQPGDDIRNMDWRITARTGKAHCKLFQEERQRPKIILLDYNCCTLFPSEGRFKSVIASQAAALLAWASLNQGDRTGGLIINDNHVEVPDHPGKQGVLAFLHQVSIHSNPDNRIQQQRVKEHSPRRFSDAMQRLARLAKPGSLVFVISDFYQLDRMAEEHLLKIKASSDCVFVRVLDALEHTPPPSGRYAITNGINQSFLDTKDSQQSLNYREWFSTQHKQLIQLSSKSNIPVVELSTVSEPVEVLRRMFPSKRQRRH